MNEQIEAGILELSSDVSSLPVHMAMKPNSASEYRFCINCSIMNKSVKSQPYLTRLSLLPKIMGKLDLRKRYWRWKRKWQPLLLENISFLPNRMRWTRLYFNPHRLRPGSRSLLKTSEIFPERPLARGGRAWFPSWTGFQDPIGPPGVGTYLFLVLERVIIGAHRSFESQHGQSVSAPNPCVHRTYEENWGNHHHHVTQASIYQNASCVVALELVR